MFYVLPRNIYGLVNICSLFIAESLTTSNVCSILEQCMYFDDKELVNSCIQLIPCRTGQEFASQFFKMVQRNVLFCMGDSDQFSLPELYVLEACMMCAQEACRFHGEDASSGNL